MEMTLVDETTAVNRLNHPFHLHGFGFYVTGMGQLTQGPEASIVPASVYLLNHLNESPLAFGLNPISNGIPMPLGHRPPLMDTASIPSKGVTTIRFRANNPGFWLMHCHFEYHMAVGMGLVVQVGEPTDFVKPPPNFPKCNNYAPDIDETVIKYKNLL